MRDATERPSPHREAVELRLREAQPTVRSGGTGWFTLEIRNVTQGDLPISLYFGCLAFDAQASNATARTFESECGGSCGRGPLLNVTLSPGGVVHKTVRLDATMRRVAGDACEETLLGPLPAGDYTLEVTLPWTDPAPIPGNAQARASRRFESCLTVTR